MKVQEKIEDTELNLDISLYSYNDNELSDNKMAWQVVGITPFGMKVKLYF